MQLKFAVSKLLTETVFNYFTSKRHETKTFTIEYYIITKGLCQKCMQELKQKELLLYLKKKSMFRLPFSI